MRRLLVSNKGQWFLISAVIATGIFLAISVLLRDYFNPVVTANDEYVYLDAIKNGSIRTFQLDCAKQGGGNLNNKENLTEYIHFATYEMAALGYLVNITPKSTVDCSKGMENFHVILLKSDKADVWEGQRPEIEKIEDIDFSGGKLQRYKIKFTDGMDYGFSINASVYNSNGFVNSKLKRVPSGSGDAVINFAPLDIPQSSGMYTIIYSTHLIGKSRWGL